MVSYPGVFETIDRVMKLRSGVRIISTRKGLVGVDSGRFALFPQRGELGSDTPLQ